MEKGMTPEELRELKAALLKAERLEMLSLIYASDDTQTAIAVLLERLEGKE